MLEHEQLTNAEVTIDLRIATPSGRSGANHTLLVMHGLPRVLGMGRQAAALLPELAEHLASESGWTIATATLRGVGTSTGTFSPQGWLDDVALVADRLHDEHRPLSMAALGFGGAIALRYAATDDRVRGVATFSTPAHLGTWAQSPEALYRAVQEAGVVADVAALPSPEELYAQVIALDPLEAIAQIPPRRLLIGHGSEDTDVTPSDARDLVAAAEGRAELRIIQSAGHQLRADPRMVATLLGWLDRHR